MHPLINHVTTENLVGVGEGDAIQQQPEDPLASLYVTRHRVL